MCFSPRHRNFKKRSDADVLCAFSFGNVLLATAARNFSTSELQKVLRSWSVLYILMSKCAACNFWFLLWPHDSAPAAPRSLLFDSPDTRIIEKALHFPTSLTFGACECSFFWLSRYCIFFLLTLLHLICFSYAFQLSILSEVYYLNLLRPGDLSRDHFVPDSQRLPTNFGGVTFSPSPKKGWFCRICQEPDKSKGSQPTFVSHSYQGPQPNLFFPSIWGISSLPCLLLPPPLSLAPWRWFGRTFSGDG